MPAGSENVKPPGKIQAPPTPEQQTMKEAAASTLRQPTAEIGKPGKQAKIPSPAQNSTEVLHQTRKIPHSPIKMVIGGFAVVLSIAYFTLYSKKKGDATALDVAKVSTGTASPDNTHPRS